MPKKQSKKAAHTAWVSHKAMVSKNFGDPEFRYRFEQRKMVHGLALVVRGLRKNAGLTQAQLAAKIGVKQPMIARIERGIAQSKPSWTTLHRIVVALGGQLKLSFMTHVTDNEPVVELDGRPPGPSDYDEDNGQESRI